MLISPPQRSPRLSGESVCSPGKRTGHRLPARLRPGEDPHCRWPSSTSREPAEGLSAESTRQPGADQAQRAPREAVRHLSGPHQRTERTGTGSGLLGLSRHPAHLRQGCGWQLLCRCLVPMGQRSGRGAHEKRDRSNLHLSSLTPLPARFRCFSSQDFLSGAGHSLPTFTLTSSDFVWA